MKLLPSFAVRNATQATVLPGRPSAREQVQHSVDRAYREMVEGQLRPDVLRHLCQGVADAYALPLVSLLRRHDSGALEVQATSRETLLWAEFMRLPERCDGTIVGNGPASRALQGREPVTVEVDQEGFMPWRAAAMRDGIVRVSARPLGHDEPDWVLLLCASRTSADIAGTGEEGEPVASAFARVISSMDRLATRHMLATALGHAGSAAFVADAEGRITWCNAAFCQLTGYSREDVIGRNPRFLSSGRHGVRHYRELWNTIRNGEIWRGETIDRDRSGSAFTANQTISPFGTGGPPTHYLAMYDDISAQKADEIRRALSSTRDALTGLMHRAALEYNLAARLEQHRPVAIGVLAARRLASIEGLGEEALRTFFAEVQSRLRAVLGPEHAARMSAGEYLLELPEDAESADRVVEALLTELAEPYPLIGEIPGVDLRIGRARAPADGSSVDGLLLVADRALGADSIPPPRRPFEARADVRRGSPPSPP